MKHICSPKSFFPVTLLLVVLASPIVYGLAGGGLSGTLRDQSGAVVPAAQITLTNTALKTEFTKT